MTTRLLSILVLCAATAAVSAQDLVFSVRTDTQGGGVFVADEELVALRPGGGSRVLLPGEALDVLVGDADGDGLLDDRPADIDACHIAGAHGGSDWLLSTTTTFTIPGGTQILDGDVFRFNETGQVEIVYAESFFEAVAATSGVDVDAFSVAPDGTLYFSFAEDETTTAAALIAENGGNAVLDEQVVLRYAPGEALAHVHFTQAQVAGFFSQALGSSFSSVVDVTGVTIDPNGGPGDLLMVAGSSSQSLVGRVVSSMGGGTAFTVSGMPVDPGVIGLGADPSLDALATTPGGAQPVLRAFPAGGSSSAGGPAVLRIEGLAPGTVVRLAVTEPFFPAPQALPAPSASGFGALYLDPMHPMWALSLSVPAWLLTADVTGTASWSFDFAGLPAGARALVQAATLPGLVLTNPVPLSVLP